MFLKLASLQFATAALAVAITSNNLLFVVLFSVLVVLKAKGVADKVEGKG